MPDIIFEQEHRCGIITLDRPEALNALATETVKAYRQQYKAWRSDNEIYCVVQQSSSERAFCAGADVRAIHAAGKGDPATAKKFFFGEYSLNWQLDRFTKPNIAIIDGIVMGGGVGVSQYLTHRIAGEGYSFAMPETAIGLFPDIGASWFLPRLPGYIGLYLGLTGRRVSAADAYWLRLVTHYIPQGKRAGIMDALSEGMPVDPLLDGLDENPGDAEIREMQEWIDPAFSASSLEEIVRRLERMKGDGAGWAQETLESLAEKSPLSLKVTMAHIQAGKRRTLRQTLEADYDLVCRFMEGHDFYEGVRARLVDKDGKPDWQHGRLEDVSKEDVAGYLEPANRKADALALS